jgi:hypothetical protein
MFRNNSTTGRTSEAYSPNLVEKLFGKSGYPESQLRKRPQGVEEALRSALSLPKSRV